MHAIKTITAFISPPRKRFLKQYCMFKGERGWPSLLLLSIPGNLSLSYFICCLLLDLDTLLLYSWRGGRKEDGRQGRKRWREGC